MGRMWPPQSVNTCPTPACLSVRATRCPPFRSAIALPELFPLHALAIHPFPHERVADPVDGLAAPAHVHLQPVDAVDEAVHYLVRLATIAAPARRRLAHGGEIRE